MQNIGIISGGFCWWGPVGAVCNNGKILIISQLYGVVYQQYKLSTKLFHFHNKITKKYKLNPTKIKKQSSTNY